MVVARGKVYDAEKQAITWRNMPFTLKMRQCLWAHLVGHSSIVADVGRRIGCWDTHIAFFGFQGLFCRVSRYLSGRSLVNRQSLVGWRLPHH